MDDPASVFSLCLSHCTNIQGAVAFNAGDALAIVELNSMNYRLSALGLPPYEGPPLDLTKAPYQVFVSSPNMDYIPDFSLDDQYIFVRKNGRFYTHDYTLWPQWYFEATKHLPFILRRPPAESLATHKLRLIWYDMTDTDFVREVGTIADVGRIRPEMVKELK